MLWRTPRRLRRLPLDPEILLQIQKYGNHHILYLSRVLIHMHCIGLIRCYHNIVSHTDNRALPSPAPVHLSCRFHRNPPRLLSVPPFPRLPRHKQKSGRPPRQMPNWAYTLPLPDSRPTCSVPCHNTFRAQQNNLLLLSRKFQNDRTEMHRRMIASHTKPEHNNPYTPEPSDRSGMIRCYLGKPLRQT